MSSYVYTRYILCGVLCFALAGEAIAQRDYSVEYRCRKSQKARMKTKLLSIPQGLLLRFSALRTTPLKGICTLRTIVKEKKLMIVGTSAGIATVERFLARHRSLRKSRHLFRLRYIQVTLSIFRHLQRLVPGMSLDKPNNTISLVGSHHDAQHLRHLLKQIDIPPYMRYATAFFTVVGGSGKAMGIPQRMRLMYQAQYKWMDSERISIQAVRKKGAISLRMTQYASEEGPWKKHTGPSTPVRSRRFYRRVRRGDRLYVVLQHSSAKGQPRWLLLKLAKQCPNKGVVCVRVTLRYR